VEWVEANGRSSVLITRDGVPSAWLTVSGGADGIDRIYWVMNPEKLDRFATAARTT
jgi:RNA polymerase sigma-70 factor (ECF subfamily)